MKKLIALVAASVISASAVFAENTFHIGAYFPISPLTISDGDDFDEDLKTTGVGGGFDFTHVADGGFTFKVGLDIGFTKTNVINDYDLRGVDFALGFGFGGSFIHDEKMTLSLTGDFGFRGQYMKETLTDYWGDKDISVFDFLFYIGPEISYTFRFNEHVGLFANFGIFYNVGFANYYEQLYTVDIDEGYFAKGFTFQPKIGVAFTL